jgi:hypothetical protein
METTNTPQLSSVKIEQEVSLPTNLFGSKEVFEHAQRVATMFSKSDLVPKQFQNNIGNCVIALEMANRTGASPLMIMQNLYIVHGKPAWSSTFLIATVNACGKFSPLRYEEDDQDGGRTRAWALDKANKEKLLGTWVSMKMAAAEGWIDKNGSKWKTMPDLMRRYRAATFFARQFAPEISMGIHTQEEIQDIPFVEVTEKTSLEDLRELYEMKKDALTSEERKNAERIMGDGEEKSFTKLSTFLKSK